MHNYLEPKKSTFDCESWWKQETARLAAEVEKLRSADYGDARSEGALVETLQSAADCGDSKSAELTAGLIDCLDSYGVAKSKGLPKPRVIYSGMLKGFFGIIPCYAGARALGFVATRLLVGLRSAL